MHANHSRLALIQDVMSRFSLLLLLVLAGCSSEAGRLEATAESCMRCHNGSLHDDYAGPGLENPHPFGSEVLLCTTCHGGDGSAAEKDFAHIPPPPEIGDREFQDQNNLAYFNRLTLTGIDKFDDYEVNGTTYTAIDYLQFINPGDLRVVSQDRSCGACHQGHVDCMEDGLLATSADDHSRGCAEGDYDCSSQYIHCYCPIHLRS